MLETAEPSSITTFLEVQAFLFREARLMDESHYEKWLALWEPDAIYWVPCRDGDDPAKRVSIIYDDRERLEQRIERLMSGSVLAVEPKPPMRRVVSNVEIVSADGAEIVVESNFVLGIARAGGRQTWVGRSKHELRLGAGGYRIKRKTVLLIDSEREIPLLQFLI